MTQESDPVKNWFLIKLNGPIRGFTKKGNFYETSSKTPLLQD